MKKIFTSALFLSAILAVNAQSAFVASPDLDMNLNDGNGEILMLQGERLSTNGQWVVGQDLMSQIPFVWNLKDNSLSYIIKFDSQTIDPSEWGMEGDPYTETYLRSGAFHGVSKSGLAVGDITNQVTYESEPVLFDPITARYSKLTVGANAAGGSAYAISDDSKTIAGFWFDEEWTTRACVWSGAQKKRTDLVWPTEEEMDMKIDYASARYMTPDAKTIMGYAQDYYSGGWVMLTWNLQEDGTYAVNADLAKELYQQQPYDEETYEYATIENPKKYNKLEPLAISDNGEWAVVLVADYSAADDWSFFAADKALRVNLTTGESQEFALSEEEEGAMIEFFGIANDGTCAGRYTGAMDFETWSQETSAVLWLAGDDKLVKLNEIFPEDPYLDGKIASAFSFISADGTQVMGYAGDEFGQTTFVATLPDAYVSGVKAAQTVTTDAKVVYDLQGRRVNDAAKGLYIVNGVKVIR